MNPSPSFFSGVGERNPKVCARRWVASMWLDSPNRSPCFLLQSKETQPLGFSGDNEHNTHRTPVLCNNVFSVPLFPIDVQKSGSSPSPCFFCSKQDQITVLFQPQCPPPAKTKIKPSSSAISVQQVRDRTGSGDGCGPPICTRSVGEG
ncbi:hypothetical protein MRB53_018790 [Persea americana]|uniref:Uncharacterized protein n=1 Tax=Persea americana TaxID=3435 RepID=A0ACC2M9S8_PERAE|nr:hypothetical protein MRB53_018790 [Persea americana]